MSLAPISQLDTFGPDSEETLGVEQARRWCRRLAQKHDENFSVLSSLVPTDRRDDFAAVYAFCRWADDLGDEIGDPERSIELLDWWRRELHQCFEGRPHHPVFIALAPTIERLGLTVDPFDDLISAFELDQRVTRTATWDELIAYCRLSANPVGRLVLSLLEEDVDDGALARSDDLCTALQLANHWQDIRRDILERDRIYIPRDLIVIEDFDARLRASAAQGYAVDRTFLGETRDLVRGLVERTWPYFERGAGVVDDVGPTARPVIWLFAAGGQRVLRLIEAWNYETALHRPVIGRGTKLLLVARAVIGARLGAPARSVEAVTGRSASGADRALTHCRDVTRRAARNFYYGLRLLPEPRRSAIYAIYAWMRRADDIVDDAEASGHCDDETSERLAAFRRRTRAALAGEAAATDPMFVALAHVATGFALEPAPFMAMLDGQQDDLDGRRYRTFDDLLGYCRCVASSVGLICITIWGYEDDRAPALAADRGVALQLTNILRDVVDDYGAGRVYLPEEDFARHGLDPRELVRYEDVDRCGAFLLEQIERAESYYARSAPLESMVDVACRPTLWAMTEIYHELLRKMHRRPALVVTGSRVRLGALRKGAIAVSARWKAGRARGVATSGPAGMPSG